MQWDLPQPEMPDYSDKTGVMTVGFEERLEMVFPHTPPANWSEYFFRFAKLAASKSKDPNTQVGCVVVGPDNEIRATGFNGIPRGVHDLAERMERPAKYLWTAHAEENAIAHAARVGVSLKGCTMYVTHQPCARCSRQIIQAGIRTVFALDGSTSMPAEDFAVARQMFHEATVRFVEIKRRF